MIRDSERCGCIVITTEFLERMYSFKIMTCLVLCMTIAAATSGATPSRSGPSTAHGTGFTLNAGQYGSPTDREVLFATTLEGCQVFITTKGITYLLLQPIEAHNTLSDEMARSIPARVGMKTERIDMDLVDAEITKSQVSKEEAAGSVSHYFTAEHPEGIRNVGTFQKVVIKNVYPGIDWILERNDRSAKGFVHDFVLHSGASVSDIRMRFIGSQGVKEMNSGVEVEGVLGSLRECEPSAFRLETKRKVQVDYVLSDGTLGFKLPFAVATDDVHLDPNVLVWGTYYGGAGSDAVSAVCHNDGFTYIAGTTSAVDFPVQTDYGVVEITTAGEQLFVSAFGEGDELMWTTFIFGLGGGDLCFGGGKLWLAGTTRYTHLPGITPGLGAYSQPQFGGNGYYDVGDGFMGRMDLSGSLDWLTYVGGSSDDYGGSLFYHDGRLWVTMTTSSTDIDVVDPGGGAYFQPERGELFSMENWDSWLMEFDDACSLKWSTYYGGGGSELPHALYANGNSLWMVGTSDDDFPAFAGDADDFYKGSLNHPYDDGFIVRFDMDRRRQWATLFGGSDWDWAFDVEEVGSQIWVVGTTWSPDFPVGFPVAPEYNYDGSLYHAEHSDGFIVGFDMSNQLVFSTYLHGDEDDEITRVIGCHDGCYLMGVTRSDGIPVVQQNPEDFIQPAFGGGFNDLILAKVDLSGEQLWSTYLGGVLDDGGGSICTDGENVWVAANTRSWELPVVQSHQSAYYQPEPRGGKEIYLAKFGNDGPVDPWPHDSPPGISPYSSTPDMEEKWMVMDLAGRVVDMVYATSPSETVPRLLSKGYTGAVWLVGQNSGDRAYLFLR